MPESETIETKRRRALSYLEHFIALPYRWQGDDPIAGFDCSGLIVEVLKSVGVLPHSIDLTAEQIRLLFEHKQCEAKAGALVFWLDELGKAIHVGMMLDELHVISAAGGSKTTTSEEAAIAQNAFIKMRPIYYRGLNFVIEDPFNA